MARSAGSIAAAHRYGPESPKVLRRRAERTERLWRVRAYLGDMAYQGLAIGVTALAIWGMLNTAGHGLPYVTVFLGVTAVPLVFTIIRWAWHGRGEE